MKIEIVQTSAITSYIGVRASGTMATLEAPVRDAFHELISRREEIKNIINQEITYGITPPNYKSSNGMLDFYCCYEVSQIGNLPPGMVHIHLLPRTYSLTHYRGPSSSNYLAYDFTTKWLEENGYEYDDTAYYLEKYEESRLKDADDESNDVMIYCPIKMRQ
ncbi:GyrI-like domain-containing protein [Cohnella herbarum]|uniref:GyrI-like domain-containing protein n=1 Tax=Cohnella herbarum TaxID=2728023 RepID=A0A7Z2VHT5_9BACL|nr:GyrI-like domain-containing protein [Cohnella herbarum]QJD83215.1 GyrI-like domain-containing protein [Cohnella herbarum]